MDEEPEDDDVQVVPIAGRPTRRLNIQPAFDPLATLTGHPPPTAGGDQEVPGSSSSNDENGAEESTFYEDGLCDNACTVTIREVPRIPQ